MNKRTTTESPRKVDRCPMKHRRAYKTSFGQLFCPDCGNNIQIELVAGYSILPQRRKLLTTAEENHIKELKGEK